MSAIIFSRNVLFKVYGIVVFTENIQTILNADLLVFEFFFLFELWYPLAENMVSFHWQKILIVKCAL